MPYYFVTADWKTLVPEGDPLAAYGVQARDLKRLGLTPPDGDAVEESPEPTVIASANLLPSTEPVEVTEPEPDAPEPEVPVSEAKAAATPANKAAKKPANKSRKEA